MNLKTKLLCFITPLLIIGPLAVGYWSIQATKSHFYHHIVHMNHTSTENFLKQQIEGRYQILLDNNLQNQEQYKSQYQKEIETFLVSSPKSFHTSFIIWDKERQKAFYSTELNDHFNLPDFLNFRKTKGQETLSFPKGGYFYAKTEFKPWGWEVYGVHPIDNFEETIQSIFLVTIGICIFSTVLIFMAIMLISQRFFVNPINRISEAAFLISDGKFLQKIDIFSRDELGELARTMEKTGEKIHDLFLTQVKLQEKFEQEKIKAEAASQSRTNFLANMSHEIRTPMNGVIGTAELLTESGLTQHQLKLVKTIQFSGNAMMDILNDILDYSKIDANQLIIEERDFSLKDLIRSVGNLFEHEISAKGLNYELQIDPSVPDWIKGDSTRIRQILLNLINNAIKFTQKGGISLHCDAVRKHDGYTLNFIVEDSGIGIPPDKLDTIFEVFTQADASTTRNFGGTGLGLSICKKLTHLMGGDIQVQSAPQKGSRFCFSIQVLPAISVSKPLAPSEQTQAIHNIEGKLILLAEDNIVNQEIATAIFTSLGAEVDVAENGQEAIDSIQTKSYDFVLMDCQMPVIDGYEATQQIRSLPIVQPIIIAMTANAMSGDKEKCLVAGMNDYISKPITKRKVLKALQAWVLQSAS